MMFVDIAVPRDIDPDIRQLANAHVFDIDDLQALAEDNIRERRSRAGRNPSSRRRSTLFAVVAIAGCRANHLGAKAAGR